MKRSAAALRRKSQATPRTIALSAAGIRKKDLEGYACPPGLSVLVLNSRPGESTDRQRW